MLKAEHKVKGGKLIKVHLRKKDSKIDFIKITGDFFMHPEEFIEDLEKILIGCPLNEAEITKTIEAFIKKHEISLLGVTPKDFAKCIIKAGGVDG